MESITKEFSDADSWDRIPNKMRRLDKFGSMYGFHVRGAYHYQTKVGAIFTLVYFVLIMATFAYYFQKLLDKSKPLVMWNEFQYEQYPHCPLGFVGGGHFGLCIRRRPSWS